MILVWRAFAIGQRAEQLGMKFAAWLAYGVGLWFGIQSLFNMGVNMGAVSYTHLDVYKRQVLGLLADAGLLNELTRCE